jgi:transcriptional regulator with XRE-family HTH domain
MVSHDDGPHAFDDADVRLGARLRDVRRQQRLSLHDVEDRSGGRLKASVLGAYERGERSVSLGRLRTLADFYGVPTSDLLPPVAAHEPGEEPTLVVDLVALERQRDDAPVLCRYVDNIRALRGDHDGRVLTLRGADLLALAAVGGTSPAELRAELETVLKR